MLLVLHYAIFSPACYSTASQVIFGSGAHRCLSPVLLVIVSRLVLIVTKAFLLSSQAVFSSDANRKLQCHEYCTAYIVDCLI